MPRPDLTPERLEAMETWFQEFLHNPPPELRAVKTIVNRGGAPGLSIREIMFSGWWLAEELQKIGLTEKVIADQCFAHGQYCCGAADPWQLAQKFVDNCRAGRLETPGSELAERLCKEWN